MSDDVQKPVMHFDNIEVPFTVSDTMMVAFTEKPGTPTNTVVVGLLDSERERWVMYEMDEPRVRGLIESLQRHLTGLED